jgi:hypothetical protein
MGAYRIVSEPGSLTGSDHQPARHFIPVLLPGIRSAKLLILNMHGIRSSNPAHAIRADNVNSLLAWRVRLKNGLVLRIGLV